ncbi:Uncharacterized protein FWK35_00001770 [Aphis craccivora]|uniref:Uncharacterized protein n=1 Tax=Aphis craccivora TaxID=307492 RepID=A0A6G0Z2A9_APHCR|nr:Uncharacterized protein FWK35_00001770 [Aphis craccivora]
MPLVQCTCLKNSNLLVIVQSDKQQIFLQWTIKYIIQQNELIGIKKLNRSLFGSDCLNNNDETPNGLSYYYCIVSLVVFMLLVLVSNLLIKYNS